MASKPIKLPNGNWRARIKLKGVRETITRSTPGELASAIRTREAEIEAQAKTGECNPLTKDQQAAQKRTLRALMEKYRDFVSPSHKGCRWEQLRINYWLETGFLAQVDDLDKPGKMKVIELVDMRLGDLNKSHFAGWRDYRLTQIDKPSVRREMTLMSSAFHTARREWGWLQKSFLTEVKRPEDNPDRDRIATPDEIARLAHYTGYDEKQMLTKTRVFMAWLFCAETALRCGEACRLKYEDVDFKTNVATIHFGKTKAAKRKVPLTPRAVQILREMEVVAEDGEPIFRITEVLCSAHWTKAIKNCAIDDLHFHDSRHMAITKLAQRFDVLALAKMVGHKSVNLLMIYYNRRVEDMARDLHAVENLAITLQAKEQPRLKMAA